jgi:hypothetical protein
MSRITNLQIVPWRTLGWRRTPVGPEYAGAERSNTVLLKPLRVLPLNEGTLLAEGLTPEADTKTATLEWLVTALDHARSNGPTKVVGYLEEVADDVVFEMEMVARRTSLVR